jgi:DNA-binding transcriptional LysR family regulator
MQLPDIDSLRCFAALAHHKNFRKAAREVALSPAAFSDRIKRLEELLGVRLFQRTTRSCTLTPDGERTLTCARAAVDAARRCVDASGRDPVPFDLVIGTRFELGLSWLTPALAELRNKQPERRLHLYFGDTDALLAGLERGACDAIVTSARLSHPWMETASLHEEEYAFVAAPALLAEKPMRSHKDAPAHTLLDLHADLPLFRYFLDGRPAREAWRFSHVQRLGTIAASAAQVRRGAGVAVLPRYFVAKDLAKRVLVEPFPRAKLSVDYFRLFWRAGHPRSDDLVRLGGDLRAMPLR